MIIKIDGGNHWAVDKYPDTCPYCHVKINPRAYAGIISPSEILNILFVCPNDNCNLSFLAFYEFISNNGFLKRTTYGNPKTKNFSEIINGVSKKFSKIFQEAFFAEQHNLLEISGVGYRKSLEFLIKDFCVKNNSAEEEKIQSAPLMQVINTYVNDVRIKEVAKRAVWLGNDETHYIRVWSDKDVQNLKTTIDLVVHWIEAEEMTKSILNEMPEPIKQKKDKN